MGNASTTTQMCNNLYTIVVVDVGLTTMAVALSSSWLDYTLSILLDSEVAVEEESARIVICWSSFLGTTPSIIDSRFLATIATSSSIPRLN